MRPGVSTNSAADLATFAIVTGTGDSDYPIANLGDLVTPSEVARITPAGGAVAFTAVLPAARSIQFAALVEHAIPTGGTVRVRFYSDALSTVVHDTTAVTIPDPTSDPQTFPVLLNAPLSVRAIRVDIAGLSAPLDIGGCELAGFWEWPWITAGLAAGFSIGGSDEDLVGGGSAGAEGEDFRTRSFDVSYLELRISTTTGIDFQKVQGLTRPFVYIEDYDDPISFPRDCFLAVNSELPPLTAAMFGSDTLSMRLTEWGR